MTGRASIRASCAALACWEWRSGYAAWEGASRSAPSRGEGPWFSAALPVAELDQRNGHGANSNPVG